MAASAQSAPTRIARLREVMAGQGIDLVALAPGAHMHWILGWHPHPDERPTLLLVGREAASVLVPSVNSEDFRAQIARAGADLPCFPWRDEDGPVAALDEALAACGAKPGCTLSLDETARADAALTLLRALRLSDCRFAGETVGALRARKDEGEIAALRRSAAVADAALEAGFAAMRPGMTEREVARVIRETFAANGVSTSFTLVASGPNGAYPHHATGDRRIEEGDAIVIDLGGALHHFASDMTRMAVIGEGPEGYDAVHAVVEEAVQAAMAAARPGVPAKAVDDAARGVIARAGYGEYFVHRTGHGLGLEVHEPPYLTATSETILEAGMVFSIEPGIYLPGRFGIRLEDIVVLEEAEPRVLSALPRTARRIG
ncbi:M24 family metallopeptidase [Salinarimonas ramus]|uniref:Peptidase M24 n=1 Tax=Salinarimonas ramus TaxID=690164 RepID=A0A917VA61_9HYPH|nr:M24 family metallopeptidase [Salinarimonas ramus]GGK54169.1 peptidase M24 [Salinarimonas ramus]